MLLHETGLVNTRIVIANGWKLVVGQCWVSLAWNAGDLENMAKNTPSK